MNVETKVWGEVKHVVVTPSVIVSLLTVKEGTRCSRHYHKFRTNQFHVMSGRIVVELWETNESDKLTVVVNPGCSLSVRPGIIHRFRVLESGHVVETYFALLPQTAELSDIVRFDEGGVDDLVQLRKELKADGLLFDEWPSKTISHS